MTIYYHDLYFKNNIKCSYVNRVSVKENGHVDFIYQFVNTSIQNNGNSNTFENSKIIEPSNKITKYEDFKEKVYEPITNNHTSSFESYYQSRQHGIKQRYINIEFDEACYPVKVSLFAPKCCVDKIRRIWAKNSDNQWFLLWNFYGSFEPGLKLQLCTPILRMSCDFKTKMLKLEFDRNNSKNHTKIDAAILIGTSEFILPKRPQYNLSNLLEFIRYKIYRKYPDWIHSKTAPDLVHPTDPHSDILQLQQNFDEYCIICKSDVIKNFYKSELECKQFIVSQQMTPEVSSFRHGHMHRFLKSYSNNKKCVKDIKLSSNESKELSSCNFSMLSDEMVLEILKHLDITSLSRISRVNKRFNNLSRDPMLYKCLNLRDIHFTYMHINFYQLFEYFVPKCRNLQQLDLSYCQVASEFRQFFKTCCSRLTHLRLSNCYVGSDLQDISDIWETSKNLKELDLNRCCMREKDVSYLKNLQCLERLHLQEAIIMSIPLCEILKSNRNMRDLNLAGSDWIWSHQVALELKNSCPNLEKLNLRGQRILLRSMYALAECKNLKEVNFASCQMCDVYVYNNDNTVICYESDGYNFLIKLFSACQHLEKINLDNCDYLSDRALKTLALCKNLKILNLAGVSSVTPDICFELFMNCPKLNEIDLSYCNKISDDLVDLWNKTHNVIVYKYYKNF